MWTAGSIRPPVRDWGSRSSRTSSRGSAARRSWRLPGRTEGAADRAHQQQRMMTGRKQMESMKKQLVAALGVAVLAATGLWSTGAWAEEASVSQIPTSGEKVEGAPQSVKRDWGTFTLNPRIAEKIKNHEKVNYVFSYQASGIPLFSQQYMQGFKRGCQM